VEELFWFSKIPTSFAILPTSEIPPGAKFGLKFTSFCVNSPVYLSYLQSRVLSLGGTIAQFTLESDSGLPGTLKDAGTKLNIEVPNYVFINALGLGARKLAGDD
jgi:D-amino-acid oxidase